MMQSASSESIKAFEKAADAIETAKYNLQGGFLLATANRAYYACYYCMTALLYTKNAFAKTHQGMRAKFSEIFIKTSVFPLEMSDIIAGLFDYRHEADYDLDADISLEEANDLIQKAEKVYQLTFFYFEDLQKQG